MRLRYKRDDSGAVAVFLAVIVLALAGLGALMVDVGAVYAEGRQLQNGAENAALRVAASCAASTAGCNPASASALVNANANDGAATVDMVCGSASGLASCPSQPQRPRFDCRPVSGSLPYAEVRTSTRRPDGSQVLPGWFIELVDAGYSGTTVRACARAAFGAPAGMTTLPMVMPACAWVTATSNGTVYQEPGPPAGPWPSPSPELVYRYEQGAPLAAGCDAATYPGNFGWLGDTDGDGNPCSEATTVPSELVGSPGNDPVPCNPATIQAAYTSPRLAGSVVFIPMFDSVVEPRTNPLRYNIVSYAAFYVSGYRFGGNMSDHIIQGRRACTGNERCISGWFVRAVAPSGTTLGTAPSMGVSVVRLSG